MKPHKTIFCFCLITLLGCFGVVTIEASTFSSNFLESNHLARLLQDREERLKSFHTTTNHQNVSFYTRNNIILSENGFEAFEIVEATEIFHGKSHDYQREGYQLVRDLIIEVAEEDPDCLKNIPWNQDNFEFDSPNAKDERKLKIILNSILKVSTCYNITIIEDPAEPTIDIPPVSSEKPKNIETECIKRFKKTFIPNNSKHLDMPKVLRVTRIFNAFMKLMYNIDKHEEFIFGRTQWYGEVSDEIYNKWYRLVNYVLICRTMALPITETDTEEEFSFLEERYWRLISVNYDDVDIYLKQGILITDKSLYDWESGITATRWTDQRFPSADSSKTLTRNLKIEMGHLARDFGTEIGLLFSAKAEVVPEDSRHFASCLQKYTPLEKFDDTRYKDSFLGMQIAVAKTLNLTYVDYNGHELSFDNEVIRGKYIYTSNITETLTFKRLRHILNALERLRWRVKEYQGVAVRAERLYEELPLHCKYQPASEFIDKNIPKLVKDTSLASENLWSIHPFFRRTLFKLEEIIDRAFKNKQSVQLGEFQNVTLFKEARNILFNASFKTQKDGYNLINHLYAEQLILSATYTSYGGSLSLTNQQPPIFVLEAKDLEVCVRKRECPAKFLRLIQIMAGQFNLKYVSEYGEEVLIDDTLSGWFVHLSTTLEEDQQTQRRRYLLNEIITFFKGLLN